MATTDYYPVRTSWPNDPTQNVWSLYVRDIALIIASGDYIDVLSGLLVFCDSQQKNGVLIIGV